MAHGDYHCCAICDRKMQYGGRWAKTKKDICTSCLKNLRKENINVLDVDELIDWIKNNDNAQPKLKQIGFKTCHYSNPVDDVFESQTEK